MPGTGGFRKVRWGDPQRGKGKRGGLRVIYYYLEPDDRVWLSNKPNEQAAACSGWCGSTLTR
jgi:hypothetical protein